MQFLQYYIGIDRNPNDIPSPVDRFPGHLIISVYY